ncbi:specifically androgen-regulated gene protein [Siniperca chuatsi]|uniref:specifically androgen-regulated gene protein n=1 Tax=Siniperca chuatsi TaxID=119488 RepID=UPI001CE02C25|nr:specifically androgen-regulated gene protein [Siniperca chuatsi]
MESLSNMDSAGSCDSVISMNSCYSDDNMEHLSPEERACLMYLEKMIETLDVQEDSGLSNDEPDPVSQAKKMGQIRVNDISSFKSESRGDQKSDKVEHHALNQTSQPQSSPASAANMTALETSVNLMTQPKPPVSGCEIPPSATQTEVLCLSTDGNGNLKLVSNARLCPGQSNKASEVDLGLIPPPSDFMDEPGPPPQPEKARDLPQSAGISNNRPGATVDLQQLHQRAPAKTMSVSSPVTQEPPNKPPELSPLAISSGPQIHPPAVAPKPKKLPANIILKSHKAAVADGNSGLSVPISSDRLLLDPQRVHIEALRKLGLLKSDEADSGPALTPKLSPKTRRSWATPPSPNSPAAPHTPPSTASYTCFNSPSPASGPLQTAAAVSPSGTSTAPAVQLPEIFPVPAAFSDSNGSLLSDNELSAVKGVSEATVNAQVNTPPLTPPALVKHLTPPKVIGVKSATLERSGLGLSSYMASQDSNGASLGVSNKQSPSQLRNNRPRPASLGSGKAFLSPQGEGSQAGCATSKEPDSRRSLPAFQHPGDSQKLPRSQGISVLICPRAENGDDRRVALKRLGLLRD